MLIVVGHIAYPVVEYGLNHCIVVYCLSPHSTHLMQPLDVACFGPLSKAYRTALQDFIYENPGRSFGKKKFWECLCIARDKALSKDNILSGFEDSGIWPEEVLDRSTTSTTTTVTISTSFKPANMRSTLSRLTMTPNSRAIIDDGLIHLEKKVVHTPVIDPVSQGLKHLRNDKEIKP